MQPLYKNENLLFKDFQEFLSKKQHVPDKRLPYYLRWVSRFHEFCSRQDTIGEGNDPIALYLQDLARTHEDWQVQQAKETVRLFRYFGGTHLLESGTDIRTVQELLGHSNVQTTMIYTHVARKNILGVRSPMDTVSAP
ncbi:MAG TPA: tyrosine-type recombinase/integrase [Dissulfurispiraceae bacterium]|nr:tyrosine-type recombinase/integrase [Dissulfurispiraceae bacterium]